MMMRLVFVCLSINHSFISILDLFNSEKSPSQYSSFTLRLVLNVSILVIGVCVCVCARYSDFFSLYKPQLLIMPLGGNHMSYVIIVWWWWWWWQVCLPPHQSIKQLVHTDNIVLSYTLALSWRADWLIQCVLSTRHEHRTPLSLSN